MNPNLKGLNIPAEVFEALELRSAMTGVDKADLVVEALRQNLDLAFTIEHLIAEIASLKANDQKLEVDVLDLRQKVDGLEGRFAGLKTALERNTEIALGARMRCTRAVAQSRSLVAQARSTRQAVAESRQRSWS
ncbi:hypothetical protein H6F90_05725 [Trichocoleus sp. FACHB-591]|uniref:hypothetical protein n=1 Tax=Trichocoleus sp. FACHB-591 TaxID=2692872 RepID=UPI00168558E1|nr:hypothetical protein [Trichocoleus sp. FACHB-591]MBD2094649.1 hypothetical protein [Trichocoleus sp. FACHB-591]